MSSAKITTLHMSGEKFIMQQLFVLCAANPAARGSLSKSGLRGLKLELELETASRSARDGGGAPGRNSELINGMGDGQNFKNLQNRGCGPLFVYIDRKSI